MSTQVIELEDNESLRLMIHFPNGNKSQMQISSTGHMNITATAIGTTLKVQHLDFVVGIQIVERK